MCQVWPTALSTEQWDRQTAQRQSMCDLYTRAGWRRGEASAKYCSSFSNCSVTPTVCSALGMGQWTGCWDLCCGFYFGGKETLSRCKSQTVIDTVMKPAGCSDGERWGQWLSVGALVTSLWCFNCWPSQCWADSSVQHNKACPGGNNQHKALGQERGSREHYPGSNVRCFVFVFKPRFYHLKRGRILRKDCLLQVSYVAL